MVSWWQKAIQKSYLEAQNIINVNSDELLKAACCNLSESFETNPSVDATFTDAVTGSKQIQMMGLSGKYVQMLSGNVPVLRGLSLLYGLKQIPGPFIHQIAVSKGAGSVLNGFESMIGQINMNLKQPEYSEKFHFNFYLFLMWFEKVRSAKKKVQGLSTFQLKWKVNFVCKGNGKGKWKNSNTKISLSITVEGNVTNCNAM